MMTVKNICLGLCLILAVQINAQTATTHMMDSLIIRTEVNPAYRFNKKIQIQLPDIALGLYTDGITIEDIWNQSGGINELSLKNGLDQLNDVNNVSSETSLNVIGIGISLGKLQLATGYDWKLTGSMNYTKDLAKLIANGNAPYIGETLDISTAFGYQTYHELYLGGSYQFSSVNIGARIKFLSGIENLSSEKSSLSLFTSDEIYQLTLDSDYLVNSAGVLDYNGVEDVEFDAGVFNFDNFLSANTGVALDLGVDWKVSSKWNISASILDIGNISWSTNVTNYISDTESTYEGVDLLDYIDDEEEVIVEDSIKNLLVVSETSENYTTSLGAKINLHTSYQYSERLTFGMTYQKVNYQIGSRQYLSANAQMKWNKWISNGIGLGIGSGGQLTVPFNTIINLGPVYGYVMSDNVVSLFNNSKHTNIRLGLGVRF